MAIKAHTTRRAVLKAAPAVMVAPAAMAAAPESEIARLFREWNRLYRGEADFDAPSTVALEAQIASATPTSVQDFAMKMVVWTIFGSETNGCGHMDEAVIAEMLTLAGVSAAEAHAMIGAAQ